MILERQMFLPVIDDVKNEICCIIPSGTRDNPITEISSNTFLDWEKLQYVYIPNNVLLVDRYGTTTNNEAKPNTIDIACQKYILK